METAKLYSCKSPCGNCPYRKDAPRQLWAKEEFEGLLKNESSQFGAVYKCHKQNGSACIGWLINQRDRNLPSIALRISLMKNNVTPEYLESLKSTKPMFKTVQAMVRANFPQLLKKQ
jgi:hypothetical protein